MATNNPLLPAANPVKPFWHRDIHPLNDHRSTEELPAHSDVVIIGAGYSGTGTAWNLVKDRKPEDPELSITVLEARTICSGATGRNGGHLRPDLYHHIPQYAERYGMEAAVEVAEFEISHVKTLKELIEKEKIDCDFTLTRGMDVLCNESAAQMAQGLFDMMTSHGIKYMEDVYLATGEKAEGISGVKGAKVCASYTSAHLWPYKFISHLLNDLVSSNSINLQTNTPVLSVTPSSSGKGYDVKTPRGSIHASKVVYASNAYTSGLLPEYSKNIIPCKGHCTRIALPEGVRAPLITNSYVIQTPDGALSYFIPREDNSIIVGGAAKHFRPFLEQWYNNPDDSYTIEAVKDYYKDYMQRTFHGWEDTGAYLENAWTGVMGYSFDSLPQIGAVPDKPDQFILAGFNGHGMPVIWKSSKAIARMVREGITYEQTDLPRLYKTTQERIQQAQDGPEGGDILEGNLVVKMATTDKDVVEKNSAKDAEQKPAENGVPVSA